jgi:hypothetical protein
MPWNGSKKIPQCISPCNTAVLLLACIHFSDDVFPITRYGTAEFDITGILKDWTVVKDAHRINSPTLLTNGGHDQVTDEVMAPFSKEIPDVQWVKFAVSSAHYKRELIYFGSHALTAEFESCSSF